MKQILAFLLLTPLLAGCAAAEATSDKSEINRTPPAATASPKSTQSTPSAPSASMSVVPGVTLKSKPKREPAPKPKPRMVAPPPPPPLPNSRLAKRALANYKGTYEPAWVAYEHARATDKPYLKYVVDQPKALWFGNWIPDNRIYAYTKDYIANAQAGNRNAVVQFTVFRMQPWEGEVTRRAPTPREIASYKSWINSQVAAIGDTPSVVILQPDLPFLMTAKDPRVESDLLTWTAQRYGSLPHTLVYLEAGSGDWPAEGQGGAPKAVALLLSAGVQYADGIALDSTHYYSAALEIERAKAIIGLLHTAGLTQKLMAVINTSSSGNPWEFGKFQFKGLADEAPACENPKTMATVTCVVLGIPPTGDVANEAWGFSPEVAQDAEAYVDGFLWFGRPWLRMQASPFLPDKTVTMVKNSPFYRGDN